MQAGILTWVKRLAVCSALAASLGGCDMYKLEELRHTAPSGTPFQSQLSRLYMDYATAAERDYDWSNSWHFADKGLMLAYGKDAPPEDLKNWDIPLAARPDLERARGELLSALTPDVTSVSPARAAEAQFYFDCWVKEQEQNWREEEIANCRDNFFHALSDIGGPQMHHAGVQAQAKAKKIRKMQAIVIPKSPGELPYEEVKEPKQSKAPKKIAREPAKEPVKEKEATKEPMAESTSYAVFFEPDKAEVSEPGMNVITEVIKSLHGAEDYTVILHSSKDHPGRAAERIQIVKKLLVAGGVKEDAIHVATGKTEAESGRVSRRVEIFLNE